MNISSFLIFALFKLLLLPLGVIIGIVTERVATRKVYLVPNKLWNTTIKIVVAGLVWIQLISIRPSLDGVESVQCVLPSSSPLLYYEEGVEKYEICSVKKSFLILITLIIKCSFLYLSTKLGVSLQPVGLTGGIACGKSTVSKILRKPSQSNKSDAFAIVDVDEIAHDILIPGKMKEEDSAYHIVVSTFNDDDILDESNKENDNNASEEKVKYPPIDRRKLGDIIFRDHAKRRKLNSITHPLISKVMLKQTVGESFSPSSNDTSTVAVDIPLLFEVGIMMKALFALKVVVVCSSEVQLERLITRNPDLTVEQCNKRIESQIPVYKKAEMADMVIWNNDTMDDLIEAVEIAREEILSRKHGVLGMSLPLMLVLPGLLTVISCLYEISIMQ